MPTGFVVHGHIIQAHKRLYEMWGLCEAYIINIFRPTIFPLTDCFELRQQITNDSLSVM